MNEPAIKLERLTRYFGNKPVVRDLDFSIPRGQTTALLGLNGAGKTTTIRVLMRLLAPTRGRALTLGEPTIKKRSVELSIPTRKRIGYLVEGHFLYPSLTVDQCQNFQRAEFEKWDERLFEDIVRHFAITPTFTDSILAYLTRERGSESFFHRPALQPAIKTGEAS